MTTTKGGDARRTRYPLRIHCRGDGAIQDHDESCGSHPVATLIDVGLRGQIHAAVVAEYARIVARSGRCPT